VVPVMSATTEIESSTRHDVLTVDAGALQYWEDALRQVTASNDAADFRAAVKAARNGRGLDAGEVRAIHAAARSLCIPREVLDALMLALDRFDRRRFRDGVGAMIRERDGRATQGQQGRMRRNRKPST
jgi:hypothetical protein